MLPFRLRPMVPPMTSNSTPRLEVRAAAFGSPPQLVAAFPATGLGAVSARAARPGGTSSEVVLVDGGDIGEVDITAVLDRVRGDEDAAGLRRLAEEESSARWAGGGRVGSGRD